MTAVRVATADVLALHLVLDRVDDVNQELLPGAAGVLGDGAGADVSPGHTVTAGDLSVWL